MFIKLDEGSAPVPDGLIPAGGSVVCDIRGAEFPVTASLASSGASRAIAISLDGSLWQAPQLDVSEAAQIAVALMAPVAFVRFTGTAGDRWDLH